MITAIHKSMAAKRDAVKNDDQGFTLIELLVVVLIIGILSAIAIPVFLGQQNTAKNASAQSDLANAKVAVISFATANNGTYPTTTAQLADFGFVQSGNTASLAIDSASASGMCLDATSTAPTPNTFKITQSGGVTAGSC